MTVVLTNLASGDSRTRQHELLRSEHGKVGKGKTELRTVL